MKLNLRLLVIWLVLVNLFALAALNRFDMRGDTAYVWNDPTTTVQIQSWNPITLHARWDSLNYIDVVEGGYRIEADKPLANIVFFPLYPLLIRTATPLVGGDAVLAGWMVSVLALAGAVVVFTRLLREFHPTIDAHDPIFYLLIFPTAFFLNAVYTESLFLLLSLLTFYYSFQGRFRTAGLFGLLAALTRVTGVLLFIPVLWELWKRYGTRCIRSAVAAPALLIPLGSALFLLYHRLAFGDAFLFFKIESAWGRAFNFNEEHVRLLTHPAIVNFTLDVVFALGALYLTYRVFRLGWTSYGLYMLATIGVALSTGTLMSIGRYVLVLFPMYIALATLKDHAVKRGYTTASVLLLAMNIALFVNWYWAG